MVRDHRVLLPPAAPLLPPPRLRGRRAVRGARPGPAAPRPSPPPGPSRPGVARPGPLAPRGGDWPPGGCCRGPGRRGAERSPGRVRAAAAGPWRWAWRRCGGAAARLPGSSPWPCPARAAGPEPASAPGTGATGSPRTSSRRPPAEPGAAPSPAPPRAASPSRPREPTPRPTCGPGTTR